MDVYKEAENALCSFYEGMGGGENIKVEQF